jgi:hypothetical protein
MKSKSKIDTKSAEALQKLKGSAQFVDTESAKTTKSRNTIPVKWSATLIDSADGSGDCYIELPDDLMSYLGWKIGDVIDFEIADGKQAILRKINDV